MTGLGDLLRATKEEMRRRSRRPHRLVAAERSVPARHAGQSRIGKWFRDQMEACGLLSRANPIHNRGIHYAIVSRGKAEASFRLAL